MSRIFSVPGLPFVIRGYTRQRRYKVYNSSRLQQTSTRGRWLPPPRLAVILSFIRSDVCRITPKVR